MRYIIVLFRGAYTCIFNWYNRHTVLPYLVPSSRIRPMATAVAAPLHPALSLASHLMLLMVATFEYGMPLSVSSHLFLCLPLLLAPFILRSIIFRPSCSHHVPKVAYQVFFFIRCVPVCGYSLCISLDSSVHSGLMFSMIHMFVFLSIHDTLSTLLQHHNTVFSVSKSPLRLEQSGTPTLSLYTAFPIYIFFFALPSRI